MFFCVTFVVISLHCFCHSSASVAEPNWQLIASRKYILPSSDYLRCKLWDRVRLRWYVRSCGSTKRSDCKYNTEPVDLLEKHVNGSGEELWRTALTFVQIHEHKHEYLVFDVHKAAKENGRHRSLEKGTDVTPIVPSIHPLKVNLDWKWTIDPLKCNHLHIRLQAFAEVSAENLLAMTNWCKTFCADDVICKEDCGSYMADDLVPKQTFASEETFRETTMAFSTRIPEFLSTSYVDDSPSGHVTPESEAKAPNAFVGRILIMGPSNFARPLHNFSLNFLLFPLVVLILRML